MMRRSPRLSLIGWALLALTLFVLSELSCNRDVPMAKLETKSGSVLSSEVGRQDAWHAAALGAVFNMGDALQTTHAAEAVLGMDDGSKVRVRQDTIIRFSNRRPADKSHTFNVETGEVLLEAGERGLHFTTNVGHATLEANGKLVIRHTSGGMQFEVTVGKAVVETNTGAHAIQVGQSFFVSVGDAVVERTPPDATLKPNPLQPDASAEKELQETGTVQATVTGTGVSQKSSAEHTFQPVAAGAARLREGAAIRVEVGSAMEVNRGGTRVTFSGPGSYILGSSDAPLAMQSGNVAISGATRIIVPGGVIHTADQSSALLETLGKTRTRLRVVRGSAKFVGAGNTTDVSAGEEVTIDAGGSAKLQTRSLAYSDVSIDAGTSVTLHDPKPPTAVRFAFSSQCPRGGIVRIRSRGGERFASGETSAALALAPGRYDYVMNCWSERGPSETPDARGTVTVIQDAGTRPVPTTPPSTSVSIDGRAYTVMYQNQLPRVTVTWPNAPVDGKYTLHVESRTGTKNLVTGSPSYLFASGAIGEGHHTIYFEGGGKVSRHTELEIAFDNAAPTASLLTPADANLSPNEEVTIAGVAQPGWTVEVGGIKLAQDGKQRFNQELRMPTDERALAVKLVHPTRGTHIYLRRAARAND